ncbi:MAG TPA: LCP family protein [Ardenticatenaceae bacterium]|jgi:LCP family protein required for cell wall assembly
MQSVKRPIYTESYSAPDGLYGLWVRLATAPLSVLFGLTLVGLVLAVALLVEGAMLYRPSTVMMASSQPPVAVAATSESTPTIEASPTSAPTEAAEQAPAAPLPTEVPPTPTEVPPTPTTVPLDTILTHEAEGSPLKQERWLSVLLMGKDARPDEEAGPTRTDTMMVAVLDLEAPSITLISIPRDVWAPIQGYGYARINTAYFLGSLSGNGREVAAETVSQVLGIPVTHTAIVDFNGFRRMIDAMGGIDINVPEVIDDPLYPTEDYGYMHLQIPAGPQHMDGETALQYARTRHSSSDIRRAERQQAVLQSIRDRILSPMQLPFLPGYLTQAAQEIESDFTLPDLFYLARFARALDSSHIHMHIVQPPLLWDGWTTDGQQVLFYDPATLHQEVQTWLHEASQPPEGLPPLDN